MKEASVNMWIGWYLVVGVVWAVLVFKHHRAIQHMRRAAGDSYTMLALFPVVLLWPAELVGLLVYCVLFTVVFLRDCIRHVRVCYDRRIHQDNIHSSVMQAYKHGPVDQTLECYMCDAKQVWGDPSKPPSGWTLRVDSGDTVEVNTGLFEYYSFWLCPECSKKESDTCHTHRDRREKQP
jgi:hypothetical protein